MSDKVGESVNAAAFAENEKEANKYSARCMCVLAAVVAIVWVLNVTGIFIVPQTIMNIAAAGSVVLFLLPIVFCRIINEDSKKLKILIMACCILGITLVSAAMPKHGVLAWAVPLALSSHYYSKKYTYWTLGVSIVCLGASLLVSLYYGEWDPNLLQSMPAQSTEGITQAANAAAAEVERNITGEIIGDMLLFFFLPRSMILVGVSAICTTLAGRTHRLLERQIKDNAEKQQIASELSVATHIQASMLPCIFPAFPDRREFEVYATMNPAKEVGGDFYDFFMVDEDHLAIVMADVSGKGVPAALFMVIGKTLIKDHTTPGKDLGDVFYEVNRLLCESNSEELFITAFEGVLDLRTGEFRFVNAGHEIPFICKRDGKFVPYKVKSGFVLAGMDGIKYKSGSFMMEAGDKLFQYTDGVTEATDTENRLYGMDRLERVLGKNADKAPHEILSAVKADIDDFVGVAPQFDDITMLCLEYKGADGSDADGDDDSFVAELRLEELSRLTEFVEDTLNAKDASPATVIKMNIALDEIFSNIVKFSGASYAKISCGVTEDGQAYLRFEDDGAPYDPLGKEDADITQNAEEREIGGLGILMVKKSMDVMEYEYKDNKNILVLKRSL